MKEFYEPINTIKRKSKLISLYFIIFVVFLLVKILFITLNHRFNLYILINTYSQSNFDNLFILIMLFFSSVIYFITLKKIWQKLIVVFFTLGLFVIFEFGYIFADSEPKYFYFPDSNSKQVLIVKEESWLLGGWSTFYLKVNGLFIKDLEKSITTDDGYRPFSQDDYKIEWISKDRIQVCYGFGSEGIIKKEIVKVE